MSRGRTDRGRLATLALALASGVAVWLLATRLFPHHSSNHDEAVYLLQAAMLLEGRLWLEAGPLADAFRPWFFVRDGGRLYPKYAPVPAGMYAVSMALFDEPRATLAVVAAGNAALVSALATAAFDRRTGLLAGVALVASPMFLLSSSVFLPYAPATLLNLLFAFAYVRAWRRGSAAWAAAAGVAVGLAFFARPYTAVLFAAPFVVHASSRAVRALRAAGPTATPVRLALATALPGAAGVAVALGYNALVTGDPLVFPYEAFAPRDGIGFGRRRILGHAVDYTPALALEANAWLLRHLLARWFVAGPVGSAFALVGAALVARELLRGARGARGVAADADDAPDATNLSPRTLRLLLFGVAASVVAGNVAFWGNYNVLGTFSDPTDGLLSLFGPFYHFDLLLPLSAFAARGALSSWDRLRAEASGRLSPRGARAALAVALVVSLPLVGVAGYAALDAPVERNAAHTAKYERAYAPFEERSFDGALVFVPTPYGEWLGHPFQRLRNDPGLDGETVYALDRGAAGDFAVLDAFPGRTAYRFTYRGAWTPNPERRVTPRVERLDVREADAFAGTTSVGLPPDATGVSVRVEGAGETATATAPPDGERLALAWTLDGESFRVDAGDEAASVPVEGADELLLRVTVSLPDGATVSYEQRLAVEETPSGVRLVWPPERSVCRLVTDCGTEGTYLPERPGAHLPWVGFDVEAERNGTAS